MPKFQMSSNIILPSACFRLAVKSGDASSLMALSKNVFCWLGVTVFKSLNARPSSPSVLALDVKLLDTFSATSTAWFSTVVKLVSLIHISSLLNMMHQEKIH